ncbi:hypothetical protein SO694_00048059 [Aureococcus anophagefferens]|uniref:Uncharacterized protein n=1 Tax=Aureococcus anophagefferens TaxID=44056 RepID=A0ABR1G891_AURAN
MSLPPPGRQLSADAATYEFELQLDYACWVRDYDLVRSTLDAMYERKVEMEPNSRLMTRFKINVTAQQIVDASEKTYDTVRLALEGLAETLLELGVHPWTKDADAALEGLRDMGAILACKESVGGDGGVSAELLGAKLDVVYETDKFKSPHPMSHGYVRSIALKKARVMKAARLEDPNERTGALREELGGVVDDSALAAADELLRGVEDRYLAAPRLFAMFEDAAAREPRRAIVAEGRAAPAAPRAPPGTAAAPPPPGDRRAHARAGDGGAPGRAGPDLPRRRRLRGRGAAAAVARAARVASALVASALSPARRAARRRQ